MITAEDLSDGAFTTQLVGLSLNGLKDMGKNGIQHVAKPTEKQRALGSNRWSTLTLAYQARGSRTGLTRLNRTRSRLPDPAAHRAALGKTRLPHPGSGGRAQTLATPVGPKEHPPMAREHWTECVESGFA